MKALKFLQELKRLPVPFITTNQASKLLGISVHSAGKYFIALQEQKLVAKIMRGKWIVLDSTYETLQIAEFITAPLETYISLHSALFHHGMIEQIPSRIYAVTVDRTRVVATTLATFSFHHCHQSFFTGYDYIQPYLKIATPEKALVDYFYFAPSRTRQFNKLPELELPKNFSWKKAHHYCSIIPSPRTKSLVLKKLADLRNSS